MTICTFNFDPKTQTTSVGPVDRSQFRPQDITRGVQAFRDVTGALMLECEASSPEKAQEKWIRWAGAAEDGGEYYG